MQLEASRRKLLQTWGGLALAHAVPARATQRTQRIVSLGGGLTEVVYLLNAYDQLVGTDTTSLFPEAALKTAKVGYMRQLSAEGLLSLRPSAVVGTEEAGPSVVLDQIRSAGVAVELIKVDHSFAEVVRKIELVGRVAGCTREASALQAQITAAWALAQQTVASAAHRPRVLFILAHTGTPMVAGTGTAADAMIRFAGGINAAATFKGYRPLTAEAMASAAPQVLLNTQQGLDALGGDAALWQRPEVALTPAFRRRAAVVMDASYLLGFGPRLPQAVRDLHTRMQAAAA